MRERELATLDKKSTSSEIAEPLCVIKIKSKNRGEKRDDTGRRVDTCCDHGLLSRRSWKVDVCEIKMKWFSNIGTPQK